jgi:AAA domain/Bifunctional DNA primase/polymerase, N-terminal
MADTDKMASAGGTAKARSYDGGEGLNLRQHTSANTGNSKADDPAERDKECGGKNLLDAGLQAAKRGWKIFPCDGKKPLTLHGFKDATTNEKQITSWAEIYPGALWGRALPKDIVVVDLDMKYGKNGIREFEKLQSCKPEQFDAPRVATATGGIHIYAHATGRDFKNTTDKIAPGVDTKTDGGYVIIPSGDGSYRWLTDPDTPKPAAPAWTEVALQQPADFVPSAEARSFQGCSPLGDAILAGACETIANTPGGQQAITLNRRSFVVGQYVGGGLIERDAAIEALTAAGLRMVNTDPKKLWTAKEVRKKVSNAVRDGMKEPLDGEEPFRAIQEVHERFFADPQLQKDLDDLLLEEEAQRKAEQPEQEKQEEPSEEAKAEPEEQEEQTKQSGEPWLKPGEQLLIRRMGKGIPTPVAFLVDGLFHEIGTGTIVSKYLGGKTFVAMALAASVSTGRPFAGRSVLRQGAVLWLAAEGEREVDKRSRAAVKALGCDPDMQPIYVQIASVPKLLGDKGEANVMAIVNQVRRAAKAEFDLPLALVAIDTMIKSAGYKKSENDAVEVNNMIQVMENISIRAKCFVLALDHMGKNEELGARGSSDKPSSVDVYIELKSNGGAARTFHAIKVKGERGDEQIDFEIVGTTLEDGQKTGFVCWKEWSKSEDVIGSLNRNARLLLLCSRDVIARDGELRTLFRSEPDKRCVQKVEVYHEFCNRHKEGKRHDMAFKRSWAELVRMGLVTTKKNEQGLDEMNDWVYLERE